MTVEEIWEEIICDSLGDMNVFAPVETLGEMNSEFLSNLKDEVVKNTKSERGPPNSKGKTSREIEVQSSKKTTFEMDDSDVDNSTKKRYTYTKEQYESFGWAREAGAIKKNELDDLYSKIQQKSTLLAFKRSWDGEAIIEVNNDPHASLSVDNVFAFVTGTKRNFAISRVVRFNAETETEMEIFREGLYDGGSWSDYYCSFLSEEGLAREYRKENFESFEQYQQEARRRSGGQESRGANQDYREREEHGSRHHQDSGADGEVTPSAKKRYSLDLDTDYMRAVESGDNEIYTATDDFAREVAYDDRASFSRSLANQTAGMTDGETKTITIYGATKNNKSRVYWFKADGYMRGRMTGIEFVGDELEFKRKGFKNGINRNSKIANLWNDSISIVGGKSESDIPFDEIGQETNTYDTVSADSSVGNRATDPERSRPNYQLDAIETKEVVRKLKELYEESGDIRYAQDDSNGDNWNVSRYNEIYTATGDFYKKVAYTDRAWFARSLANKTDNMKSGERRSLVIYGSTRKNKTRLYLFDADGYMHGRLVRTIVVSDDAKFTRKEYKNGIDGDSEIANLWSVSLPVDGTESGGNFLLDGEGRGTTSDDTVSSEKPEGNRTGHSERSQPNYQLDAIETKEVVRKLKELYEESGEIKNVSDFHLSRELDLIDYINENEQGTTKKRLTNRAILVNALESVVQDDGDLKRLKEYKAKVAEAEALEAHLAEVNKKINEITFTKGAGIFPCTLFHSLPPLTFFDSAAYAINRDTMSQKTMKGM